MSSATERLVSSPLQIEAPKQNRQQKLIGERAVLDGFMLMEQSKSPNESLQELMNSRIIDQADAVESIVDSLDRSEVRLDGDNRPVTNLAFLGPTGVGKSETAKTLHEQLGGPGKLVKIDCSIYAHGHEISGLVGSPLGYVGSNNEPMLSKNNIEKPGTVILFDEIEKGSPELYNLMLQIMGDGEVKLNNGSKTSFRESVIILTSNLGAKEMADELSTNPMGFGNPNRNTDKDSINRVAEKSFNEFFAPEFINRLNKAVVFHSLSKDGLDKVLDVKLDDMNQEYEQDYGVHISISDTAREQILGEAQLQPHMGARPLVRSLENNIQSEFGRYIGTQSIPDGTHINVFHRSEIPEDHQVPEERQFVFAMKRDESLLQESVTVTIPTEITGGAPSHASPDVEKLPRPYYGDTLDPIFHFASPTSPKRPNHSKPSISLYKKKPKE